MAVQEFAAREALQLHESGKATLVDIRPPASFAQDHLRGALAVSLSARGLARRIANVVPPDLPLILVDSDRERLSSASDQITEAGSPPLQGISVGTQEEWRGEGLEVVSFQEASASGLREKIVKEEGQFTVLDVREPMEWEQGHVPGAILISLGQLPSRTDEVDRSRPVYVICEAGVRSSTGASILQAAGFSDVINVTDGSAGYRNAGYPLAYYTP